MRLLVGEPELGQRRGKEKRGRPGRAARPGEGRGAALLQEFPGIMLQRLQRERRVGGTRGPAADWAPRPLLQQPSGLAASSQAHTDPVWPGRSVPPGLSVMVGSPQPRAVGSPRPRVIVGTIRPRVIVGSARSQSPRDGTLRSHLAVEGSPRPRVDLGTPRARVIVGSPRPRVIVSSPWPAVVVESPRPRAPVGSPWPRVIVGTPRSRVIVGSPPVRVAGAVQASAASQGVPQGGRKDEHTGAGAEGPHSGAAAPGRLQGHVGLRAAAGCGRGGGGTIPVRGLGAALPPCEACCIGVVPSPPPSPGLLRCGTWARSG